MPLSHDFQIMIKDLTLFDGLGLVWFLIIWFGYATYADRPPQINKKSKSLNELMWPVRKDWMIRMLDREGGDRIIDSSLIGHTIHSISFFASAAMIIIAALIGLLGNAERAFHVTMSLGVTVKTSMTIFELKIVGLLAIFVMGFYRFTWALRQYNYCCALIGAAPLAPVDNAIKDTYAEHAARMLSLALTSFNRGLRAYYAALAWLGWFIHPIVFLLASTWMLGTLLRRQYASQSLKVIQSYNQRFPK